MQTGRIYAMLCYICYLSVCSVYGGDDRLTVSIHQDAHPTAHRQRRRSQHIIYAGLCVHDNLLHIADSLRVYLYKTVLCHTLTLLSLPSSHPSARRSIPRQRHTFGGISQTVKALPKRHQIISFLTGSYLPGTAGTPGHLP